MPDNDAMVDEQLLSLILTLIGLIGMIVRNMGKNIITKK